MKMGKLDSALSDFSKACELQPTAAVYHYQKASLLHHRLGRCETDQQKRVVSDDETRPGALTFGNFFVTFGQSQDANTFQPRTG